MKRPGAYLTRVREQKPVVHAIMNQVAMSFVANGVLAAGGRPMMARHPEEAAEAAAKADALVLNLGTPEPAAIEAMLAAGRIANEKRIPIVFDPVGIGLSRFRQEAAERILQELRPAAICGNEAELAFLLHQHWEGRGIDAVPSAADQAAVACGVAHRFSAIAILTGKTDVIADKNGAICCDGGHEWLTSVTGTGCLSTALVALFLAAVPREEAGYPEASAAAMSALAVAAENARTMSRGPGSFQAALLDALYELDESELNQRANLRPATESDGKGACI